MGKHRTHLQIGYSSNHPLYKKTYYQEVVKPKRTTKPLNVKEKFQCFLCGHNAMGKDFAPSYDFKVRYQMFKGHKGIKWYSIEQTIADEGSKHIFKERFKSWLTHICNKSLLILKKGISEGVITPEDISNYFNLKPISKIDSLSELNSLSTLQEVKQWETISKLNNVKYLTNGDNVLSGKVLGTFQSLPSLKRLVNVPHYP